MNGDENIPRVIEDGKWSDAEKPSTTSDDFNSSEEKTLETDGPNKSKPFNVLNQDGSLADLPDGSGDGSGALDGTVGLGT